MKTKTFSILFALVMVLSMSAGVLATDFTETWDEETVLTVFNDLDIVFPDLFADVDSDFLWNSDDSAAMVWEFPKGADDEFLASKDVTLDDVQAKAPVDADKVPYTLTGEYDPCGDGLIKFEVEYDRSTEDKSTYDVPSINKQWGPDKYSYIRYAYAIVDGYPVEIKKCSSKNDVNCHFIKYDKNGKGKLSGYLYYPNVITGTPTVELHVFFSDYMTALWDVPATEILASGTVQPNAKRNYCQTSLSEYTIPGLSYSVRAQYDENTGEARMQATIRNFNGSSTGSYVIPADIQVQNAAATVTLDYYTDYVCKYTVYNNANGAPRTDYCKYGEGIALSPNAIVRFDVTFKLDTAILRLFDGADIPFTFRVGGMNQLVNLSHSAALKATDFPCPAVTRMAVMDPLRPFMTFFEMDEDEPIEASGPYGVYEGGLWGLYQKCGRYAYMAVRLMNDGVKEEVIDLKNVAVAVNGGTPMKWEWVLTSVEADHDKIELEGGEDVVLILRAKVTDLPYQLNADTAMTGAVNFLDYGLYITGKVYSDHNNTNCTVAP